MMVKLLVTSVMPFFRVATIQMPVGISVVAIFIILIMTRSPYIRPSEDRLHLFALLQLLSIMMCSYIISVTDADELDPRTNIALSVVLIGLTLALFATFLYMVGVALHHMYVQRQIRLRKTRINLRKKLYVKRKLMKKGKRLKRKRHSQKLMDADEYRPPSVNVGGKAAPTLPSDEYPALESARRGGRVDSTDSIPEDGFDPSSVYSDYDKKDSLAGVHDEEELYQKTRLKVIGNERGDDDDAAGANIGNNISVVYTRKESRATRRKSAKELMDAAVAVGSATTSNLRPSPAQSKLHSTWSTYIMVWMRCSKSFSRRSMKRWWHGTSRRRQERCRLCCLPRQEAESVFATLP
jgi:hypothetical protein